MPREGLEERQESTELMDCGKNEFYRLLYSRGSFFGEDEEEDEEKESKRWKGHSLLEFVAANSRTCIKIGCWKSQQWLWNCERKPAGISA